MPFKLYRYLIYIEIEEIRNTLTFACVIRRDNSSASGLSCGTKQTDFL